MSFLKAVGVSLWKKGHYDSHVPLPTSQAHMNKGQKKQSDLLNIVFIMKRACLIWYTSVHFIP